ncbi:tRNA 2-selenouridine(34) synthase MnmH [Pseudomonas sp. Choline-3u-10]|jgi:tRNA 2-selenouridine synthase|uniref:tRNA 2-selenouridine(34) synthase MnmH n=1 Tax=Pseudomonadaceae TaxID=135621 RepID=UPI000617C073|nr:MULTISPECIES: tRNA 2-selenouridine(34) synthase MnmH [Pseudomonadaceae]MAL36651.1 tRNA 2-selenouridine(34) synthase MnmH [Pseudomonas sp.]MBU0948200.1 tRNA 2-selenouridine(34) synthase MnmH [Gammaproteobacteria bacterium]KJJ61651.1 tRNA 2-selenouridine synthase [Pseudomonas sp. 10B238]MBK3795254.1 tRNA 2-selenouridine(34) synthase MnmH [Stutzerimonas stutzeri]MBK3878393.1 tRNA 2-selenouridine(34) synthase MnmH [Stutzerimonas stutzeri]|tara:strand:- start:207 stop:1313 length:1107 start_codon:yes stop_codon:yes gene_type:complete
MRGDTDNFAELFLNDVPMMDARAPVEFAKGAFPGVVNLPLMNDLERQKVGTCYKQHGQQAAIELGHRLVSGQVKADRIQGWADFARNNPQGYIYCFRGGLRSQLVQQWLKTEAGIDYPRVTGGYKAMRHFLLETIEHAAAHDNFVLVGGMTGTGKTEVLARLDDGVDLEGIANHRGSSFGKRATPQPVQIDFENALAIRLLKMQKAGARQFVLEDEARLVGRCSIPLPLFQGMQHYPLVWLEDSFDGRVDRILKDYVIDLCAEFTVEHGAEGFTAFAERLQQSLVNISRRLGGECYTRLAAIMDQALAEQASTGSVDLHREWIETLLRQYYDPMYAYQRESKAARIEFAGEQDAVVEFLRERAAVQQN